jgi:pimeloyl-ACP methyl ester carboxylesterase
VDTPARIDSIPLPDGRALSYAAYGDPGGTPAFYFHGFPGSRLEARLIDGVARARGVRLLALDRPGYGRSDFQRGRSLLDWPRDVAAAAGVLGLERFAVIGASGGGPYALACARSIPDRLLATAVLCGLGPLEIPIALRDMMPLNRAGLAIARRAPWLALPLFAALSPWFRRHPRFFVDRLSRHVSPPDRDFLARPEYRETFAATFCEAFRGGPRGPAWDARLYTRPWGFRPEDISAKVFLWHGERDRVVPASMSRRTAEALADGHATFHPDDGHFTVAIERAQDVFDRLLC